MSRIEELNRQLKSETMTFEGATATYNLRKRELDAEIAAAEAEAAKPVEIAPCLYCGCDMEVHHISRDDWLVVCANRLGCSYRAKRFRSQADAIAAHTDLAAKLAKCREMELQNAAQPVTRERIAAILEFNCIRLVDDDDETDPGCERDQAEMAGILADALGAVPEKPVSWPNREIKLREVVEPFVAAVLLEDDADATYTRAREILDSKFFGCWPVLSELRAGERLKLLADVRGLAVAVVEETKRHVLKPSAPTKEAILAALQEWGVSAYKTNWFAAMLAEKLGAAPSPTMADVYPNLAGAAAGQERLQPAKNLAIPDADEPDCVDEASAVKPATLVWPMGINPSMDQNAAIHGLPHWSCVDPRGNEFWMRKDGMVHRAKFPTYEGYPGELRAIDKSNPMGEAIALDARQAYVAEIERLKAKIDLMQITESTEIERLKADLAVSQRLARHLQVAANTYQDIANDLADACVRGTGKCVACGADKCSAALGHKDGCNVARLAAIKAAAMGGAS